MAKKLSKTRAWELAHPNDVPCPRGPDAAKAWRLKRGLQNTPEHLARLAKYEEAMAAKRAAASGSA
jgi:hypothetical protein